MRRALLAAVVLALLTGASPASAADVVVRFDDAKAVAGESADDIYLGSPGFLFGSAVENPQGGEFPTFDSCGTVVDAVPTAPSAPHVARIVCGGPPEFPDPPVLFGKLTSATRTRVAVTVGDTGNGGHVMRLSVFDGQGRLLNRSPSTPIAASGTTLQATAGQPEITYFVIEETGSSFSRGVWIDNVRVDTPPVAGKPQFGIVRTAGEGIATVRQGLSTTTDITIYRINGSEGNVDFSLANAPPSGVATSFSPSVNGRLLRLQAGVNAPLTGFPEPVLTVVGTPHDANTGTVTQRVSVPIRVTPAITVNARFAKPSIGLPTCGPIQVDYDVADDAGPANFFVDPLPPGVTATINGVPQATAPAVSGRGSVQLDFTLTQDVTAEVATRISLLGRTVFDTVDFASRRYSGADARPTRPLAALTELSPTSGQTPRELGPGTTVRIRGDDACAGPSARLRFGNDRALAPIRSLDANVMTAEVPRLATPGNVQFVTVDGAGNVRPGRADGPRMEIDNYRNSVGFDFKNYKPRLTIDQMVAAFGRDQVYFTPNICGAFTFGLISCKLGTPIPDPWAMIVLEIANRTMGGDSGGACFGFSITSQQLRRGTRSLNGLGRPGATNAFGLGEGLNDGPPGGINEAINANHLTELSEEYLDYYARNAVGNVLLQSPGRLRAQIEDYLRRNEHPLLSLRNGGTVDSLHVVVAYDVYTDPADPSAYYVDVYDSNVPFLDDRTQIKFSNLPDPQFRDELEPDGTLHEQRHGGSRIHVRGDGSWSMPSSNYGGRTVENIISSGFGMPPSPPTLITAAGGLKNGLTILFGWAASGLTNLRADLAQTAQAPGGEETPPGEVTQIRSGNRFLYSEPGVINSDPATALRATPWAPSTQAGDEGETTEGFVLAAGPGASYEVEIRGDRNAPQTRTIVGNDVVSQITTAAKDGVTDEFSVVPRLGQVGYDPGSGSGPLTVQMMTRAGDGSTRTAAIETTTTGSDEVSFDQSQNGIVIEHEGPPAAVDLTLSSTGRASLPQAVTAKVRIGRNGRTTLKPKSWRKLGKGKLTVRSKGRTKRVRMRRKRAVGAKLTGLRVARDGQARVARAKVRVPASVEAGAATVTYVLRRGRRAIASTSMRAGGPGRRTLSWTLPGKARRGDRVVAAATTIVASGSTFNSAVSHRQAAVR